MNVNEVGPERGRRGIFLITELALVQLHAKVGVDMILQVLDLEEGLGAQLADMLT